MAIILPPDQDDGGGGGEGSDLISIADRDSKATECSSWYITAVLQLSSPPDFADSVFLSAWAPKAPTCYTA